MSERCYVSGNGSWGKDQPDQVNLIDENGGHSPRGGCLFALGGGVRRGLVAEGGGVQDGRGV